MQVLDQLAFSGLTKNLQDRLRSLHMCISTRAAEAFRRTEDIFGLGQSY